MVARLGNVLYWLGCIIAGLSVLCLMLLIATPGQNAWYYAPLYFWIGVGAWLIGRACRYVLSGT